MKVRIWQTAGIFTLVQNVNIPVRTMLHEVGSITEAADWLAKYCGYNETTISSGNYEFEEII